MITKLVTGSVIVIIVLCILFFICMIAEADVRREDGKS